MRLIDADKIKFSEIDEIGGEYEPYLGCSKRQIDNLPPVDTIPIPKGVTNGDMMIAIYGIVDVEVNERSVRLFPKDGGQLWVTRDWWKAPYKWEEE